MPLENVHPQDSDFYNKLDEVVFVVEATSYEHQALWLRYHKRLDWEQISEGRGHNIGEIGGRPIWVSLQYAKLDGFYVLFWYTTSPVADTLQMEKWLDEHCNPTWDNGRRRARTDANNFHHVLNHLNALAEYPVSQ